jgi:hypothetical protein
MRYGRPLFWVQVIEHVFGAYRGSGTRSRMPGMVVALQAAGET